jgi:hypothetical protein
MRARQSDRKLRVGLRAHQECVRSIVVAIPNGGFGLRQLLLSQLEM